jgi:hypothetical protein
MLLFSFTSLAGDALFLTPWKKASKKQKIMEW